MKELSEEEKKRIIVQRYKQLQNISQQMLSNNIAFNSQPGASNILEQEIKKIAENFQISPDKFPQKIGELIHRLNISQYGYNG